jgi:hypothetical protein
LKAQGYDITKNILYQDNKSSILLEKNGKASSSKRMRHIAIRYFFITDRIAKGELTVEWCPTANMIADFMTKPTQGAIFRKFRDIIMGIETIKSGNDVSDKSGKAVGTAKSNRIQAKKMKSIAKIWHVKEHAPQECVGRRRNISPWLHVERRRNISPGLHVDDHVATGFYSRSHRFLHTLERTHFTYVGTYAAATKWLWVRLNSHAHSLYLIIVMNSY